MLRKRTSGDSTQTSSPDTMSTDRLPEPDLRKEDKTKTKKEAAWLLFLLPGEKMSFKFRKEKTKENILCRERYVQDLYTKVTIKLEVTYELD